MGRRESERRGGGKNRTASNACFPLLLFPAASAQASLSRSPRMTDRETDHARERRSFCRRWMRELTVGQRRDCSRIIRSGCLPPLSLPLSDRGMLLRQQDSHDLPASAEILPLSSSSSCSESARQQARGEGMRCKEFSRRQKEAEREDALSPNLAAHSADQQMLLLRQRRGCNSDGCAPGQQQQQCRCGG